MTSSDGQPVDLLSPMVFTNGTAVVNLALATPSTVTLTAVAGAIQQASGWIVVNPPPPTRFVVTAPSSTTAGVGFTVSVTAENDSGDTLAGFNGDVALSSSDGQTVDYLTSLALDHGVGTATVVLDTADMLTLTAVSGTTTGASGTIVNSPAAASRFIVRAPATATVGIGFAVTITAEDTFGNVVPGFSAATTLTSSDGQTVVLPVVARFQRRGGHGERCASMHQTRSRSRLHRARSTRRHWHFGRERKVGHERLVQPEYARSRSSRSRPGRFCAATVH